MTKKKEKNTSIFGVIKFLFGVMDKKDKSIFVIMTLCFALSGFLYLLPSQITAIIVSVIAGEEAKIFGIAIGNNINIITLLVVCFLVNVIPNIFIYILGYFKNRYALRLYMKTKKLAYDWATTPRKNLNLGMTIGDATYRINNSVADIEFVITCYFDTILPSLFSAILSAIYVIILEIYALPILIIGLILVTIVFIIRQKKESPITVNMEKSGSRLSNFLVNSLKNLTIINIFKSQSLEKRYLNEKTDDYEKASGKRFKIWAVYWFVMGLIDILSTYLIIVICYNRAGKVILASDIVLILSYVAKVYSPIQDFGWFINSSTQLMTKIIRLKELEPTKDNIINTTKDNYEKRIEKITLKDVTVVNDENNIISNINYEIKKGELTVVTGASGGGKTTSLRALIGIAEKESGEIIINDEYKAKSMYSFIDRMSVVMQSPFIFNRDVKDNIYYPEIEKTKENKQIVNNLNMSKIINKKYDEDSEQEMELMLSGGEKKRICLLRGILQDKEVYIFDEPTNELDAENTKIVLDYITNLKEKAIVMVVTHDKRMIDNADKVVCINNSSVKVSE